jgi:hypothetical protein
VPYALYANSAATAKTALNAIPAGGAEGLVLQMVKGVPTWIDGTLSMFFKDRDKDGYGDINSIIFAYGPVPTGYVTNNTDCNDDDPEINPGQIRIYGDGIDNNCDGIIDEPFELGSFRAGGVVFYIASTPTDLDGDGDLDNGLVCAISDQSAATWRNNVNIVTGATGIAIGTGASNTNAIIVAQGAPQTRYAAGLARAYTGGGFNDWFLPSKDELYEMYINRNIINQTAIANGGDVFILDSFSIFWSSSEIDADTAWYLYANGNLNSLVKLFYSNVRAVRAF